MKFIFDENEFICLIERYAEYTAYKCDFFDENDHDSLSIMLTYDDHSDVCIEMENAKVLSIVEQIKNLDVKLPNADSGFDKTDSPSTRFV